MSDDIQFEVRYVPVNPAMRELLDGVERNRAELRKVLGPEIAAVVDDFEREVDREFARVLFFGESE